MYKNLFIFISCLLFTLSSFASDFPISDLKEITGFDKDYGVIFNADLTNGSLDVIINEDKALDIIPFYQKIGVINSDLSQADIDSSPITYAIMIGYIDLDVVLPYIYHNTSLDNLNITYYITTGDLTDQHQCLSFSFTRDDYNSLSWDSGLDVAGLIKISDPDLTNFCSDILDFDNDSGSNMFVPTSTSVTISTTYSVSNDNDDDDDQ